MTTLRAIAAGLLTLTALGGAEAEDEVKACCRPPSRWAVALPPEGIEVRPSDSGAVITVAGEPFAEYVADAGRRPAIWPIYGPGGRAMTRSWPIGPLGEAEVDDHPHHTSLWLGHGDVNGHDFWHDSDDTRIVHRAFTRLEIEDAEAVVETTNDWVADGAVVVTDRRTIRFGLVAPSDVASPRYIDFTAELTAPGAPVTFGDTKEGTFAVRVPGPMKLTATLDDGVEGGRIESSRGRTDGDAWGRPAEWVAYSGPLTPEADGPRGGIAIYADPSSWRPAPRWHVRDYGLFAANPFGDREFPAAPATQGAVTLAPGESLVLRYRVVLFAGDASALEAQRVR